MRNCGISSITFKVFFKLGFLSIKNTKTANLLETNEKFKYLIHIIIHLMFILPIPDFAPECHLKE